MKLCLHSGMPVVRCGITIMIMIMMIMMLMMLMLVLVLMLPPVER